MTDVASAQERAAALSGQSRARGIGTSRSGSKAGCLRALGAQPIVLDVLDAAAVRAAVAAARPEAIIYQCDGPGGCRLLPQPGASK